MSVVMSDADLDELNGDIIEQPLAVLPPSVDDKVKALSTLDGESQARAVTALLSHSRTGLLAAIASQDLKGIVEFKAKASAIQEMSKQLRLGKELQLDAAEFVRRAERGLGVGIREGQANGTIETPEEAASRRSLEMIAAREAKAGRSVNFEFTDRKPSPNDYLDNNERNGSGASGGSVYDFTDGVTDEQFEEALAEAKDEGNLSRANVARKAKSKSVADPKPEPAKKPAEPPARPKGKKFNSANIIRETSIALEGLVMGVGLAYIDDLDTDELKPYIDSINSSLRTLAKFSKGLKNV
ncbi:hypothetical protein [Rhodococcus sp. NPDC060176]|uniref:hypothetical protein n=1 Tax=Rhodococcus sp. NPDC060176 TaxID=3347062 RepID=UPI00364AF239